MAKKRSKTGRRILIVVILLLLGGGVAAFAFLKKREPIITVQTDKVSRRNITELVLANGRIQPVFQVKISPEVSGEIIDLPVKEGQLVKKGDLLLRIKPDMYTAAVSSSEANFQGSLAGKTTSEANLTRAKAEWVRIEKLFKENLVSESAYVDAKANFEVASAQVESATHQVGMAKAALDRAKEDLAKTTIFSPLDGTISRLNSQLGERVVGTAMMAGTEVMTVADLNEMEARVDIGEMDVVLLAVGQVARLEVDAFKDKKFAGRVTEIANSSRTSAISGGQSQEATKFEVKIRVKDKETFRPGMSVTAEIETRSKTNVLAVPYAAVTTRLPKGPKGPDGKGGGDTNAAKADSKPSPKPEEGQPQRPGARKQNETTKQIEVVFIKDGEVAKMVPVKTGISDDNHTEILEGLKESQEVISGGYKAVSRELEDGKKVKIGTGKPEGAGDKDKDKK